MEVDLSPGFHDSTIKYLAYCCTLGNCSGTRQVALADLSVLFSTLYSFINIWTGRATVLLVGTGDRDENY